MQKKQNDPSLESVFQALRREDEAAAPDFSLMWQTARARAGRRRSERRFGLLIAAAAAVVLIAGLLLSRLRHPPIAVERDGPFAGWRSPTAALLQGPPGWQVPSIRSPGQPPGGALSEWRSPTAALGPAAGKSSG